MGHHAGVFSVEQRDATCPGGWEENDQPCYVLALEVRLLHAIVLTRIT